MFIGKYYHTLESKGRISLPKKFREKSSNWVITRGLDGGLFLFTAEAFFLHLEKLQQSSLTKKKHRDYLRIMSNEAVEIEIDTNGRVHLPEYLIEFAKLEKEIVIVGSLHYVEVWDRETYHNYIDIVEEKAEIIAESIEIESNAQS